MTTIELQDAPTERVEDEEEPPKFLHLVDDDDRTICGHPRSYDDVPEIHRAHPYRSWYPGDPLSCPSCGLPICLDCILASS